MTSEGWQVKVTAAAHIVCSQQRQKMKCVWDSVIRVCSLKCENEWQFNRLENFNIHSVFKSEYVHGSNATLAG